MSVLNISKAEIDENWSKLLKWIPVAIAGVVAVCQSIGDQKEAERIDDMEERIAKLEETGDDK